jgi:hypothetical protein
MDTLPFPQKIVATRYRLGEQTPHIRPLDADTELDLRRSAGPKQIDFRMSRASDMDMRWFVVERVDDEPEAIRTMHDDHGSI